MKKSNASCVYPIQISYLRYCGNQTFWQGLDVYLHLWCSLAHYNTKQSNMELWIWVIDFMHFVYTCTLFLLIFLLAVCCYEIRSSLDSGVIIMLIFFRNWSCSWRVVLAVNKQKKGWKQAKGGVRWWARGLRVCEVWRGKGQRVGVNHSDCFVPWKLGLVWHGVIKSAQK